MEVGLKWSSPGFLSVSLVAANLKSEGIVPEVTDELTMSRISGVRD